MPRRASLARRHGARHKVAQSSSSSSEPGTPLLLFPKVGYLPTVFKGDLEAVRQINCKQGYLAIVKTNRTIVILSKAENKGRQSQTRNQRHVKLEKDANVDSLDCESSQLLILSSEGKLFEYCIVSSQIKSKPRLLKELRDKQIVQIACGDHHSIALSKGGELFTWGQNEFGQLGVRKEISATKEPQLVQALSGIPLGKIAAGAAHSLALSVSGTVYSWGKNAFGQLGLGHMEDRYFPTYVSALEHKKTVFISCGGEHTAVLSKEGLVCTFGAGTYGQLGHNSTRNELFPRYVAELFGTRVSQVACGRWHTLVYIPDLGKVYSFGLGEEGEFGIRKKCNQLVPLPIDLTVTGKKDKRERSSSEELVKIIAGENLSIVIRLQEQNSYVNLNRTLSRIEMEEADRWVSNSNPQCWKNIQQDIKLIFSSVACLNGSFLEKRDQHFKTSLEVSGVNMFAVVLFTEKIAAKPKVFREVINAIKKLLHSPSLSVTSPETFRVFLIVPIIVRKQDIRSDCLLDPLARAIRRLPQEARQMLESLWSSLEDSILKDLVDMYQRLSSIRLSSVIKRLPHFRVKLYDEFRFCPVHVLQVLYEIYFCLLDSLTHTQPMNLIHQEALSSFLLLPECSAVLEAQDHQSLGESIAEAVHVMSERSSDLLEKYWSSLPACCLDIIVQMLKKAVVSFVPYYYNPTVGKDVIPVLEVLERIYMVNKKANYKLPLTNFYINEVAQDIFLAADLLRWNIWEDPATEIKQLFCFCRFPFVFNLDTKLHIFHLQCLSEQEAKKVEAEITRQQGNSKYLLLRVQRRNLVEDTLQRLSQAEDSSLKSELLVDFVEETNQFKSGGVIVEFFTYVFGEMVQPEYGMFTYFNQRPPMWFPTRPSAEKKKYFLFGVLLGLALSHQVTVYVPFPLAAFKKLMGKNPCLDDLKELSPVLGRSLQAVLDYEYDDIEENLQLCYSIFWDKMAVDLIPNGSSVAVNNSNKKDFVNKYVDYIFNKSVEGIFEEFKRGFYKVLQPWIVGLFEPEELMEVAIGNANYDWDIYEKNAVYSGIYSPDHPTIKMFWNVFHELTADEKIGFLLFVTGCNRVPLTGMASLKLKIHSDESLLEDHIPEAYTCSHFLLLPCFSKREKLKEKFLQAIYNNRGFCKK